MDQSNKTHDFARLHRDGCFVMPNPWDVGTARYFQHCGFRALGTTSAGLAFANGLPDTPTALDCEAVLAHIRQIVEATPLPVNADFQAGYADTPAGVARNVARCVATGVAGLSIEDASDDPTRPLFEISHAVERIAAARAAIDESGTNVVLTGRCEAWLFGVANPFEVAIERLVRYAEAGADCLYAPGVNDLAQIRELVAAVAPKPLNLIVSSGAIGLRVSEIAELGVRRISIGSGLARMAWGAVMRATRELVADGRFDAFDEAASFAELDAIFTDDQRTAS
ncbi:MAG: isocitrate lyase/phosphoenolpyruvate mutase family protein [Myxococcales bacterium]|nr:isocitrate lyase/phosphoenolpyruvate mutase family protein [Myxococcales bacterium]